MKLLCAFFLTILLSACAVQPTGCLRLGSDGWYCPSFIRLPDFETEQATTVNFRNQSMHLITRIRSGSDGVHFVGVSPLGQTIISASWHDGVLSAYMPPGLDGKLDPILLPALLELALAPADNVRHGLGGQLRLEERAGRRSISSSSGEEIEIFWEGSELPYQALRVRVLRLGLTIESMAFEEEY